MILGTGIDLAELPRIEKSLNRWGQRFLTRILAKEELPLLPANGARQAAWLAGRFAAKEAAVKALGTGFAQGIGPKDIAVIAQKDGSPRLLLHGKAQLRAQDMGVARMHLSITHERAMAAAVVILES